MIVCLHRSTARLEGFQQIAKFRQVCLADGAWVDPDMGLRLQSMECGLAIGVKIKTKEDFFRIEEMDHEDFVAYMSQVFQPFENLLESPSRSLRRITIPGLVTLCDNSCSTAPIAEG